MNNVSAEFKMDVKEQCENIIRESHQYFVPFLKDRHLKYLEAAVRELVPEEVKDITELGCDFGKVHYTAKAKRVGRWLSNPEFHPTGVLTIGIRSWYDAFKKMPFATQRYIFLYKFLCLRLQTNDRAWCLADPDKTTHNHRFLTECDVKHMAIYEPRKFVPFALDMLETTQYGPCIDIWISLFGAAISQLGTDEEKARFETVRKRRRETDQNSK